jgi:hypothetical protein
VPKLLKLFGKEVLGVRRGWAWSYIEEDISSGAFSE